MAMVLIVQFVAAAFSVMLGAFILAWAVCKVLEFEDRKEGNKNSMLTDILQDLYDAIQRYDVEEIEQKYKMLEKLGMDRITVNEVLKAGEKYFGRETR